jgi:hypothetical protein
VPDVPSVKKYMTPLMVTGEQKRARIYLLIVCVFVLPGGQIDHTNNFASTINDTNKVTDARRGKDI